MALRRQGTAENFRPPEEQDHPGLPQRSPAARPKTDDEYNRNADESSGLGGLAAAREALDPVNTTPGALGEQMRASHHRHDAAVERARAELNRLNRRQVNPQDQRR